MTAPLSRNLMAGAAFCLLLAAPLSQALAADDPPSDQAVAMDDEAEPAKPDFNALDKDKDGALSASEIPAEQPLADAFTDVDSDGDGKLSKDEFDAYTQ